MTVSASAALTFGNPAGSVNPISQVCQSLSRLTTTTGVNLHSRDLQNEAIKSMFTGQQQQQQSTPVQMVRVREAWAETPEREQVVLRRKSSSGGSGNLNLANNNNREVKRRSYHPQDHLSRAFGEEGEATQSRGRQRRRPADFPKVKLND